MWPWASTYIFGLFIKLAQVTPQRRSFRLSKIIVGGRAICYGTSQLFYLKSPNENDGEAQYQRKKYEVLKKTALL